MDHELISLKDTIKKYLGDGEIVFGAFIVLRKTFDNVNRKILLEKLKHYGIKVSRMIGFDLFL